MKKHPLYSSLGSGIAIALIALAALAFGGSARAATYIYDGTGTASVPTSANWNVGTSWDVPGLASSLDNVLVFGNSGTNSYTATNNFAGDFNLNQISLGSTSSGTISIPGGTLNFLNNSGATGPSITQNGSGTATISSAIKMANTLTLDGAGLGTLNINAAISGSGIGLTKSGAGIVSFGGAAVANTYTGLTTVSGGELQLNKTALTNAIAGDVTVGTGTLKLMTANQIADTSTVTITAGGTFAMNGKGDTVAAINISSGGATATLNLGGHVGSSILRLGGATPSLTFGANTQLIGAGGISSATAANPLTFNFNGGQVSGGTIQVNGAAALTDTTFNITAGMGGGTFSVGGSGNSVGTVLKVNLNHTGIMNLGSTILAYSNNSGGRPTILNITVANTATGMSGGIITPALIANAANPQATSPSSLYNGLQNTLTFTSGGTGFTLSGGVLDVRSSVATAGYGAITTNGNNLTISGGTMLGNSLASTTGAITLSSGNLGLRNTAASTNFTISTTDGSDGRTIKMLSGNTGTFTAASGTAGQRIIIAAQSDGGTWDRGTLNAGSNYTITNSGGTTPFGSAFASYSVAANSGLNGVIMGANAIPTLLTLGANSSFFVASSTAAARTYEVGVTGGGNDIVVAASGSFGFGINNTVNNVANAQIINLNRDKGADIVSLISNGAHASNAINIASNQTGAGNLYVMTRILTLNSGVSFGGTGGIYTDLFPGNGTNDFPLSNFAGNISGTGSAIATVFNINGTINGTNTVSLNQDHTSGSTFAVGSTAVVGGTQTWTNAGGGGGIFSPVNFSNAMTTGANWTSGSVSFTTRGSRGTFEASTSTLSPSTSSNYKFNSLSLAPAGNSPAGGYKLLNTVQNDGGSAKEAFYAGTFAVSGGIGDGSNGHYLFSLNGQDLYVDSFSGITGLGGKGMSFQNDALNTTSEVRALSVTGATLVGGSFQALNGATLQFNGGNVNNLIFNRNTGGASGTLLVADTAAAPNVGTAGGSEVKKTLFQNNTTSDIGTFTSFLGSGNDAGTNTNTTAKNTNGTLRVIGGSYSTSGYILNPVGTTGLIDTTDGVTDTTLNDVLIRGNTASDSGGAGNATTFPALIVAGTTTINGNLVFADASGAANQSTLRVGGVNPIGALMQNQSSYTGMPLFVTTKGSGYTNGTPTVSVAFTRGDGTIGTVSGTATISSTAIQSISLDLSTATGATLDAATVFGAVTVAGGGSGVVVGNLNGFPVYLASQTTSNASLTVGGDLTVGSTNNLAIQSNAIVKVGGNVSILGVGTNLAGLATGTGVGIHADSHFTLNGNQGVSTPQTVNVVPSVGNFHVGDGSDGTLTGTAAQVELAADLTSATSADVNGATSALNLGGFTLTANGTGLAVGGTLSGNGTVAGAVTVKSGGTLSPGNSPGLQTLGSLVLESGSTTLLDVAGSTTPGTDFDQINITTGGGLTFGGTLTFNFTSALANDVTLNLFDFDVTSGGNFSAVSSTGAFYVGASWTQAGDSWSLESGGQTLTFSELTGDLNVVPEPATWALLAFSLTTVIVLRRRRSSPR